MNPNQSPAEELLIEQGVFERRSEIRRAVLGCIGCRWNETREQGEAPSFHGYQALKCSKMSKGAIYQMLGTLEAARAVVVEYEDLGEGDHGRPPRKLYHPSDTELGQQLEATLREQTPTCNIDYTR